MKKAFSWFGILIALILIASTAAFAQQLDEIRDAIKQKGQKWVAEETTMSVLPDHEKLRRLGLLKMKATGKETVLSTQVPAEGLAMAVDWSNYVTPVRNQGSCGSCWAFATTAALESQFLMKDGMPLTEDNRAEQILLSCSGAGNCQSGGYIDSASNYLKSTGLPAEPYFPYTATDNACSNAVVGWQNYARKIGAWSYVNTAPANLTAIKNALAANGPLVTTMDVYSDFFSYVGGVYEYATGSYQGGHAILIVGYTDDPAAGGGGYFKVKNSWGAGWGSGGYFLIAYSQLGSPVYFGEWTLAYSIPTVPPPPAAPSSLSATPVSSGQINLAWTANAANQDGYKIERCTGSGCANFVQVATAAAGAVAYSNTGLSAGTYYSYRVRAYNTGGDSDYSNMAGASTMALQPPSAPASLQATAASASQINLAWTDASSNEDGFRIERCAGNGCIDFLQIASVGAGVKSYSNSGLAVGAYTYRVRAYNAAGASGYSNTAAAATLCTCTLTPASLTFGPAGGTGTVTVNTAAGCAWTAATTASWITFSGSTSGSGTGGFTYLVPKTTARRTGTITVLGQTHSLVQSKK